MVRKMLGTAGLGAAIMTAGMTPTAEAHNVCVAGGARVYAVSVAVQPPPTCVPSPIPTRPTVIRQGIDGVASVEVVVTYP